MFSISFARKARYAIVTVGILGLAGLASTDASASRGGGGGGHGGGSHFGGGGHGHFGGHFGGGRIGGNHWGGNHWGGNHWAGNHWGWNRWGWNRWGHCGWYGYGCRRPIYVGGRYPTPVYTAPTYTAPQAYSAPAQPSSSPVIGNCGQAGPYISVMFQPTVTAADVTIFLKNYNLVVADGPTADGVYKLKASVGQDQYGSLIEAMKSQTNVVSQVSG